MCCTTTRSGPLATGFVVHAGTRTAAIATAAAAANAPRPMVRFTPLPCAQGAGILASGARAGGGRSDPRSLVHARDPGQDARVGRTRPLIVAQDAMEQVVVVRRQRDRGVLEEREGRDVGGGEPAEEVVAPGQEPLDRVERAAHGAPEALDAGRVLRRPG